MSKTEGTDDVAGAILPDGRVNIAFLQHEIASDLSNDARYSAEDGMKKRAVHLSKLKVVLTAAIESIVTIRPAEREALSVPFKRHQLYVHVPDCIIYYLLCLYLAYLSIQSFNHSIITCNQARTTMNSRILFRYLSWHQCLVLK